MAIMSLRLCAIHVQERLADAFRTEGCEVLRLCPTPGQDLDLPAELDRQGFSPDLVLQQELLGPRVLLNGLERLDAVRAFWAIDPHLNAFWQAAYARRFDVLFTTQRCWSAELESCGAGPAHHLPWYAPQKPFTPFAERVHDAAFIGRLGPSRQARAWLVALMRRVLPRGFELRDDLSFEAMLDFTCATRLIPNESITSEVNFRLFEAAGCGAVVLAQDLGPEQAELFEPGREIMVCADSLELVDNVRLLTSRPRLAEAMGRAAWERARRDHQPANRARAILAAMIGVARGGSDASRWLALARAALMEAGRLPQSGPQSEPQAVARELAALPVQDGAVLAARLRLAAVSGDAPTTDALLQRVLAAAMPATEALLAGSMAALRRAIDGDAQAWGPALALSRRAGVDLPPDPVEPVQILLAWSRRLASAAQAARLGSRGGFPFDPARHLPASAQECLFLAKAIDPANATVLRALAETLGQGGSRQLRLGVLSELGLRAPGDWRTGLALGLCDLQLFRPEEGLGELALAARLAVQRGEAEAFATELAAADSDGRLGRVLAALQGGGQG
jgi:hypothetical protein